MKRILILILSALLLIGFTACDKGDNKKPASKENINTEEVGSVESEKDSKKEAPVPTEEYVLYKETNTKLGNFGVYEYNEKGHPTKKTWNYTDGETMETIYTYTYEVDGSYSVVEDGKMSDFYQEYDQHGNLILTKKLSSTYDNCTVYEYDDLNRPIKVINKSGDNITSYSETFYNEDGTVAKEINYDGDGVVTGSYEYEYDEKGREILRHDYNENGEKEYDNALYFWEEETDEFGRVTSEKKIDSKRGGTSKHFTYEYDEQGGMCKKGDISMHMEYEYRPLSECIR